MYTHLLNCFRIIAGVKRKEKTGLFTFSPVNMYRFRSGSGFERSVLAHLVALSINVETTLQELFEMRLPCEAKRSGIGLIGVDVC